MDSRPSVRAYVAAAIVAAAAAAGLTAALEDTNPSASAPAGAIAAYQEIAASGEPRDLRGPEAVAPRIASTAGAPAPTARSSSAAAPAVCQQPALTHLVRNQSSRNGARVVLGVLHTTEGSDRPGLDDLRGLGFWFDNPRSQASSNDANDAEGHLAHYVPYDRKAWTVAHYNPVSVNLEQVGFARKTRAEWLNRPRQLESTARWTACMHARFAIPIRLGAVSGGTVTRSGFIGHVHAGKQGGGHHDPGNGFPYDRVLERAREIAGQATVSRKELHWRRSHRIAHAKLRAKCSPAPDHRRGYCAGLRARNRKLHQLLEREARRRAS